MISVEDFKKLLLPYNTATNVYTEAYQIQWARYLNGFLIHNTGNTNILFNGDLILPGDSKSVGGNYGEVYQGRLEVRFVLPVPAPPPPIINQITIDQKFYLIDL